MKEKNEKVNIKKRTNERTKGRLSEKKNFEIRKEFS